MPSSLTVEQRIERARNAAKARWSDNYDWESAPLDEAKAHLGELRAEMERGSLIIERRDSSKRVDKVLCYNPDCYTDPKTGRRCAKDHVGAIRTIIDVGSGRFGGHRDRRNPATGLFESAYACSAACFLYLGAHFTHFSAPPRDLPPSAEPEVVQNEAAKEIVPITGS